MEVDRKAFYNESNLCYPVWMIATNCAYRHSCLSALPTRNTKQKEKVDRLY